RFASRQQSIDEPLHQLDGAAEQEMILSRALLDAHEQFVVFIDERLHERPMLRREQRQQGRKTRVLRATELLGERLAAFFALKTGVLDRRSLVLDEGDGLKHLRARTLHYVLLLAVELDEHFAVLLQFLAQGDDEILGTLSHTPGLPFVTF